jgi:hypothetical protein
MNWLTRILGAVQRAFTTPVEPLSPDARRELERWDADEVGDYYANGGGVAPPDAPTIDEDGI